MTKETSLPGTNKGTMFDFLMATDSYDIRRYLAILFSAGGSITLTAMLGVLIWLLAAQTAYLFWISIGLLVLVGLHQTGFISLLVKRSIIISKDEVQIVDRQTGDTDSGLVRTSITPEAPVNYNPGIAYNQPFPGSQYGQSYTPEPGLSARVDSSGAFGVEYQPMRDTGRLAQQP